VLPPHHYQDAGLILATKTSTMAKTNFTTVQQYIESFDKEDQVVLQAMKQAILKAVPDAEETISYQIPAFKSNGWIFYLSAYKNHFSVSCPPPFTVFDEFKKELAGFEKSKSTVQFPKSHAVPYDLLSRMSKFRAEQNLRELNNKTVVKKKVPKKV
jgi:uncharacterized protein YdhG (YjbR/CyaY superfamily)